MTPRVHLLHGVAAGSWIAALALVAMWFAMMSAMMAPVAWPWVLAFRRFDRHAAPLERLAATVAFIGGYGAAWLLYSAVAAGAQIAVATLNGVDLRHGLPATAAALVLVTAGIVQFTPLKRACLTHCRNPFTFLLARWPNGATPPWRLGFAHGVFCVGCCWALMATALAVGMTNLWWMVALTVATLLEQATTREHLARTAIGVALLAAGCTVFLMN